MATVPQVSQCMLPSRDVHTHTPTHTHCDRKADASCKACTRHERQTFFRANGSAPSGPARLASHGTRPRLASTHQRCINGLRLSAFIAISGQPCVLGAGPVNLQAYHTRKQEVITGLTRSPWLHLHPAIRPHSCSQSAGLLQRDIFQEKWTHHNPPSSKGSGGDTPCCQRTTPSTIWDLWRRGPPAMAMMTTFVPNAGSRVGTATILAAHCCSAPCRRSRPRVSPLWAIAGAHGGARSGRTRSSPAALHSAPSSAS